MKVDLAKHSSGLVIFPAVEIAASKRNCCTKTEIYISFMSQNDPNHVFFDGGFIATVMDGRILILTVNNHYIDIRDELISKESDKIQAIYDLAVHLEYVKSSKIRYFNDSVFAFNSDGKLYDQYLDLIDPEMVPDFYILNPIAVGLSDSSLQGQITYDRDGTVHCTDSNGTTPINTDELIGAVFSITI